MNTPKKTKAPAADKPKKIKVVRDSFCIPKEEYASIDALKARALGFGVPVKKSELLRAGLAALVKMSDAQLQKAIQAVPTLKTGRPSQQESAVHTQAPAAPAPVKRAKPAQTSAAAPAPAAAAKRARAAQKAPAAAPAPQTVGTTTA